MPESPEKSSRNFCSSVGLLARRGLAARYGIVAPGGTPRPIVDRLNAVISSYIKRPDVSAKLDAIGILPITSTPDEFAAFIPEEIKKWAQVVKDAGIQPQ